ncbi:class I SAM-dependent methyltransferase [Kocuria carniphila]|uniref:Class I SAM-dependent methyltransferase n=1 Tax=Kocuria carniphila TaxID=262208 RepID=A0ABV3V5T4_9MICC
MNNKYADEPNVYAPDSLDAYHSIAQALSPGIGLVSWVQRTHPDLTGLKVLDLGAGTGVSSTAFSQAGAHVTAVDASRESLEFIRSVDQGDKVRTVCADFRDMDPAELFDIVVLSRNTFFSAIKQEDKIGLLRTIRSSLSSDGTAYLDCTDPYEFLKQDGSATSVSYPLGKNTILTTTQFADRTTQSIMTLYMLNSPQGIYSFHENAQWCTLQEIQLLTKNVGLQISRVFGSYAGELYGSNSREMMVEIKLDK